MFNYKLKVFTGDMGLAGTRNRVFLQLVGMKGSSDVVHINKIKVLRRSSHKTIEIKSEKDLGQLYLIRLSSTAISVPKCGLDDEWFCSKIIVTTPENLEVLFPCYNWLSADEPLAIRDATAVLVFKDFDEGLQERKKELLKRQELFKWHVYLEGLPECVEIDDTSLLPRAVRFSFTKDVEFKLTPVFHIKKHELQELLCSEVPWSGMDEYKTIHSNLNPSPAFEYISAHWDEDEVFGDQYLNGVNPILIQRCMKLPDNFPVTDDMVQASIQGEATLTQEIQNGNIYLADYVSLNDLPVNVINGKQQYMAAPLVLLYKTPDSKLMPIAIQLKQKPAEDNPIFFPTDSKYDWLTAKIFVSSACFADHEMNTHLLRTHLLVEAFAMATMRNLPPVHPLYKLLIAHYRYTFHINILARKNLISKDGVLSKISAIGGEGLNMLLQKEAAALTYSSLCLPDDVNARGLESIPNYYYRDDGCKLWDIIHRYVQGVVKYYYACDSDVKLDSELQMWIKEIFIHGFMARKETGIPESLKTIPELVKFVTMVIFTASVQHSAVNFGQHDYFGWMPNCPSSLQKPPPTTKGQCTEESMWETFPDINATAGGLVTINLLSSPATDFVALGSFPNQRFVEETPLQKIQELQKDLEKYAEEVKQRNETLPLGYTFLYPENIENSVAI